MKFNKLFKVYTPNLLQYEKKIVFITKRWMCNNSLTKSKLYYRKILINFYSLK